jgi:hypothetical protein
MNLLVFIKEENIAEVMMALANQFPKLKLFGAINYLKIV